MLSNTIGIGVYNKIASPPEARLATLVKSLGGYLFIPNMYTYADQNALAPAASTLDSQVGYVGSATTQAAGENLIPNSEAVGATPTTVATGWTVSNSNGITTTVVDAGTISGVPYQDIHFFGTATATAYPSIQFDNPAELPNAFARQLWSIQVKAALIAGSYAGFNGGTIAIRVDGSNSSGGYIEQVATKSFSSVISSSLTQLTTTGKVANISSTRVKGIITGTVLIGQSVDLTLRIAQPQLERGHPTAYTPTYGTAISRGVFAAASQSTLADTPILRAGGLLEFDGSTDHLVTGIVPGVNGYWGAVVRQDEGIGTANCVIGCGALAGNIAGVVIQINASGNAVLTRYNTSGTNGTATTSTAITAGVMAIIDGDWTVTASRVRINGAGEGTGTSSIDVTGSTSIALIAAKNTAKDGAVTAINFLQGKEGIVWMVPATVPDATQAQIRQLAGQIYGVTTA